MSVACVKIYNDRIVLGADSIVVYGDMQEKQKDSKIRKINDCSGFASSGYAKEIEFFFISFVKHINLHIIVLKVLLITFLNFQIGKRKK